MKQQQLLACLALAAFALVSAPGTQAAEQQQTAHAAVHKARKHRVHRKPARKPRVAARKPVRKPAPAVAAAKPSTDTQSRITRPGDYSFLIQQDGRARTYRVHVPPGYASSEPAPLVVALNGSALGRPTGDGIASLARESDRQGFVAVFPDAYKAPGETAPAAWNAGTCCGAAHQQKVDDVAFIERVIANVFRQVSISRLHIYAAGMSDGGMMAYRLACERPFLFRAVASVGGTDNTADCTPGKPVSVLHIHARNDPRVPFAGPVDAPPGSKVPNLSSAVETAQKWARLDGCMETPRPILDKAGASCQAYSYCRSQVEVQLCATDTGGHSWPGSTRRRGGDAPSQAIAATPTIWAFFSSH